MFYSCSFWSKIESQWRWSFIWSYRVQECCWCTSVSNSYQTRYLLFSEPSLKVHSCSLHCTLDCCQKDTVLLEIFYSSWPEVSTWLFIHNYSDADYAGEDPDNRQSTGGYCVYLGPHQLILFYGAPKLIAPFLNPVLRQNTGNWHSQLKFHGFVPCSVT